MVFNQSKCLKILFVHGHNKSLPYRCKVLWFSIPPQYFQIVEQERQALSAHTTVCVYKCLSPIPLARNLRPIVSYDFFCTKRSSHSHFEGQKVKQRVLYTPNNPQTNHFLILPGSLLQTYCQRAHWNLIRSFCTLHKQTCTPLCPKSLAT